MPPSLPNLKSALQESSLLNLVVRRLQSQADLSWCFHRPVPQVLSVVQQSWGEASWARASFRRINVTYGLAKKAVNSEYS